MRSRTMVQRLAGITMAGLASVLAFGIIMSTSASAATSATARASFGGRLASPSPSANTARDESASPSRAHSSDAAAPSGSSHVRASADLRIAIRSATAEVASVAHPGAWDPVSVIYQGSPARIRAQVDATEPTTIDATVSSQRTALGHIGLMIPAGISTVTVPLTTNHLTSPARNTLAIRLTPVAGGDTTAGGAASTLTSVAFSIAPRPVIFIHGMWEDASWWNNYTKPGGFLATANPEWKGFAVNTMDTGSPLRPLASVNTIDENADLAWAYIHSIMGQTNAQQVDIVAHSLGGIITRRMLHDSTYGGQAQAAVREVILLGVPNGGSPCSTALAIPANRELTTSAMTEFNKANPGYPGVHTLALYSSHWSTTCLANESGDSMVPTWSALAQPVSKAEQISPGIDHAAMTTDSRIWERYIKPELSR